MRISTFFYCLKEGIKNIFRNILFSLASVATISACIFLFCLFFGLVVNVQYMVQKAETNVGITVFFEEEVTAEQQEAFAETLLSRAEIKEIHYISAEEAWESFQKEYFKDMENLAEGFADDNPLAGSASYEIFLKDIAMQGAVVSWLESLPEIRRVNYSDDTAAGLVNLNRMLGLISAVIIAILLAVSVFLISNTISIAAAFRKDENRIMRLIGATNFMIRAPFVVEGLVIGLIGALIPLWAVYFLYRNVIAYMLERFHFLSRVIEFLPIQAVFPYMAAVAMALGVGIGFAGSFFTIRRQLKV